MPGFETLQFHYRDRLAAARHAQQGVVGIVGNTVPRELVLAADRLPVLVAASLGASTPVADTYMEPVIPPETRVLFEAAVSGELQFLDLLVFGRPYAQLYYYLKEVQRMGRAPKLPPLHMHDLMVSRRPAVRAYNWQQTQALIDRLERLVGGDISDAALERAIARTNRVRQLQRELIDRRWRGMLSGVDAVQALGAGYFMAPEAYAEALGDHLDTLRPDPALSRRVRLLVLPSAPVPDVHLHQALEAAGGLVVAEDDWWGARAPGSDMPLTGSPREAVFQKAWLDAAVVPAEAREAWFCEHAARPDVDCVVFYLPPSDHQLGWDYPRLRAWLDECGKPSLRVRDDAADPDGRARITQQAGEWISEALEARA